MIECPVDHPELPQLFDEHVPNNPALWAVFQGRHTGRAVVDELLHPSQCVVRTDATLTYASRNISQVFLTQAIENYRHLGPIWLVRAAGDPRAVDGYRTLSRLEFYDYEPSSRILAELRSHLLNAFKIQPIDMSLLKRCEWRDDMAFYCGSLENFIRNDLGVCLMQGEQIIVEAYASALGSPYAEIGAITHEPYRGMGYAPITVAFLVEALEQRGFHAYWSCDVDNPASASVARKLGFKIEKPYETWEYKPEIA